MKILVFFLFLSAFGLAQNIDTKNKYECFWNQKAKSYVDCMAFTDSSHFQITETEIKRSGSANEVWYIVSLEQRDKFTTVYHVVDAQVDEQFIIIDRFHGELKISLTNDKIISYSIVEFKK